jgi:hypothetical protein
MNSTSSQLSLQSSSRVSCFLLAFTFALASVFVAGCGGGSGSTLTGNTAVTVLASSTANDQLSQYRLTVQSLTLTSQSGTTVTLLDTPQTAEYIHLNGGVEPLTTVSIPEGVYTAATATVTPGGPTCVGMEANNGGLLTNGAIGFGPTAASGVTVKLPSPITVTGTSMGLELNLQVAETVSSFDCVASQLGSATITPTFNLTALTIATQPTNQSNGKAIGLHGLLAAVETGGSSFSVTGADGPTWQVASSSSTVFQGVTGAAQLAAGMPVDMDVTIQAGGVLLATRVAVYDANPSTLTMENGPLLQIAASQSTLFAHVDDWAGPITYGLSITNPFSFNNAVFQISGQLANVQSLPFTASFNASNMVDGQNVFMTTHATAESRYPIYVPVTTMTLIPQTINGKVISVSTSGNFTVYTVTLAAYDLFPDLAVQPGQTTVVSNPGNVVIYVDGNTQLLSSSSIAVGSVLRFNGLVFNDSGTLRMDCAQVNDGVAE